MGRMRVSGWCAILVCAGAVSACGDGRNVETGEPPGSSVAASEGGEEASTDDAVTAIPAETSDDPGTSTPTDAIDGWRRLDGLPDVRAGLTVTAAAADDDVVVVAVCDTDAVSLGRDEAVSVWRAMSQQLDWQVASLPSADRCPTQIEATPFGFFAVGPGIAWRSDDGTNWREWTIDGDPSATALGTYAVFSAPDGSRVTVLQLRPAPGESTVARMLTTTDGVTWQPATDASSTEFDNSTVAGVIPGGDGLLAFGAATGGESIPIAAVFTSPDGVRWRRVTPTSDDYQNKVIADIVRSDSGFVAVGGDFISTGLMTAWTSPDGIAWTRSPHPQETVDPATAYMTAERATLTEGRLWAVGTDFDVARNPDEMPALWVSDDGVAWTRIDLDAGAEIVPFEITTVNDVTLASWPPDPRLSDEPLEVYMRTD